jgi:uncharacterized membrane protein YdjX (TVP38/TMEM64 family)
MRVEKSRLKFYLFLSLLLAVIIVSLILHIKGFNLDLYKYLINLKSSKFLPIIYILLYFVASFFPIPFLTFLGATIFSFQEVFILSMVGNIIFMVLMFYLTRWFTRDYIEIYKKNHAKLNQLDIKLNKHSFLYLFLLRLFFIAPPEAVNILAGLSKIRFREYISASILGTIPVVLMSIALVKSYQLKDFNLLIFFSFLFVLLIVIPLFFMKELRRYFKKGKKSK